MPKEENIPKDSTIDNNQVIEAEIDNSPLVRTDSLKHRVLNLLEEQVQLMEDNPNLVDIKDLSIITKTTLEIEASYRGYELSNTLEDFLKEYDIQTQFEEVQAYLPTLEPRPEHTEIIVGDNSGSK